MNKSLLLTTLVFCLCTPAFAFDYYQCEDKNGNTSFSNMPCANGSDKGLNSFDEYNNKSETPTQNNRSASSNNSGMGSKTAHIKATQQEEEATKLSMAPIVERMENYSYEQLAEFDAKPGCPLDLKNNASVGRVKVFNNVPMKCMAFDSGYNDTQIALFLPVRLINLCNNANVDLRACIESIE